jgi:hypothetical protein
MIILKIAMLLYRMLRKFRWHRTNVMKCFVRACTAIVKGDHCWIVTAPECRFIRHDFSNKELY